MLHRMKKFLQDAYRGTRARTSTALFYLFRLFPLQDKVVASSYRGKNYSDNPRYILEMIHRTNPSLKIYWQKDPKYRYQLPSFIKSFPFYSCFKKTYHLATAKVWIDSNRTEGHIRKRKGQLYIQTWHGGLGIKKIQNDVKTVAQSSWQIQEINNTSKLADLFISNSNHITQIYRNSFHYTGKIWKCGYPKNDILVQGDSQVYNKVRKEFHIPENAKIFLYAPTFRETLHQDMFDIDWEQVKSCLDRVWGGSWEIFVRWHPSMAPDMKKFDSKFKNFVHNATLYPDMQELILACNAFMSDYSSGIFDAALCKVPCFSYAPDYDEYKENHGVYYELSDLPFPFAKSHPQLLELLEQNSNYFNDNAWNGFTAKTGLYETGHSSKDIADLINEFIKGNKQPLDEIQSD